LDDLLEAIARHGFQDLFLLIEEASQAFLKHYSGRRIKGASVHVISYAAEAPPFRALGGTLKDLDDVVLLATSERLFDINYLSLSQSLDRDAIAALGVRPSSDAQDCARVSLDGDRVTAIQNLSINGDHNHLSGGFVSGGVCALRRDCLDLITSRGFSFDEDVLPSLIGSGKVQAVLVNRPLVALEPSRNRLSSQSIPASPPQRPAVFFDRDGTLTVDKGFTHRPEDLDFLPGAVESIRLINDAGGLAIVVTNQSGIARGFFGSEDVLAFHEAMQERLRQAGAHIDAFYICPFHEVGSNPDYIRASHPDRKPNPGMIHRAMLEWSIDPEVSFLIGDRDIDRDAAMRAGLKGFVVTPGNLLSTVERGLETVISLYTGAPISEHLTDRAFKAIAARASIARDWLFEHALPQWWQLGYDRKTACFHERLHLDGQPAGTARRLRAQARQTFVYAIAGKLGWNGPWREAVSAGADVLIQRALRPDGGTRHTLDQDGRPLDHRRDLYDTAFVAFGLTHAGAALDRSDCLEAASRLVEWTYATWSHPKGGLFEGELVDVPPRRQNPHMHMLEALIALYEATGERRHLDRAGDIVDLLTSRFISPRWGALLEYFDDAWSPAPGEEGRITEPGHQFEWSWLLDRYQRLTGVDLSDPIHRLYVHGEAYGVSPQGFTVDEVWAEGGVRTPTSRLWPHTERIKANIIRVETRRDPLAASHVVEAFDALMTYCDVPIKGLWRDRRMSDGSFVEEASPASSFYHIILAMSELIRVADTLKASD
jgi:mannose-6-phosphate isomerase